MKALLHRCLTGRYPAIALGQPKSPAKPRHTLPRLWRLKSALAGCGLAAAFLSAPITAKAASISGSVFFDFNGNGGRDAVSEFGLPQWSLQLVPVSPAGPTVTATTDVNGRFSFGSLAAGDYTLAAVNPSPWLQTSPGGLGTYLITLAAADNLTGKDFGCKQPVLVPQMEWQKSFGGSLGEGGGMRQTRDGGYIVVGSSASLPSGVKASPNYGGDDFWIQRLDAAFNVLWDRTFGGPGNEWVGGVQETSDGGFILAGPTDSGVGGNKTSGSFGGGDCWVVRIDSSGNKLWEREVGGDGADWPYGGSVIQLQDGGFLLAGASDSGVSGNKTAPSFGGMDGWVVRLDASGNKLWDRSYGGAADDEFFVNIVENPDGTVLLPGDSWSEAGGNKTSGLHGYTDFWLVKIAADGTPLWDHTYGGSVVQYIYGAARTPDGGLLMCGVSSSGISGNKTAPLRGTYDSWLVRVDANGDKLWDQSYGGSGGPPDHGQQCTSVCVLSDGRLVLGGGSDYGIGGNKVSPLFGLWDRWVMLTDANGNPVWDQDFGGSDNNGDCGVTPTADGGVIISARTGSNDGNVNTPQYGLRDILAIKLAPCSCVTSPLNLLSAAADCDLKKVTLTFSAPVNPATALQAAHYAITGGPVSVQSVTFGASTLTVILDTPSLLPGVTYTVSVQGLTDDCGNSIAPSAQIAVACAGQIRGKVFSDQAVQNCIQGPGEFTLANWPVQVSGPSGSRVGLTDAAGKFAFSVPAGSYTVEAKSSLNSKWNVTCPVAPGIYTEAVANGQILPGKDFGLAPTGPTCADLWVDLTATYPGPKLYQHVGGTTPCCGANFTYRLSFGNSGNAPSLLPGLLTLLLPANCTLVGITPATTGSWTASGTVGTSLPVSVVFNSLVPPNYQSWVDIEVHLDCDIQQSCDVQPPLLAEAVFTPLFTDCNFLNNWSDHQVVPCCSSDPNDCTVTPKGCGPQGLVHRDQALTYLVQFQNLGGGAAHLVVVNNTLDADLDLNTLEIIGSSHPNVLEQIGRTLTWVFPNIGLASAGVDEKASHGYVKFRVRARADAPVGTVITNSAEITFDINAPITTMTALNTITADPVPMAAFEVVPQLGSAGAVNNFRYTGGTANAEHTWYFGPDATPQSSTLPNPTGVVFSHPGPHLVSLRTRLGGCESEPAVRLVTVGPPRLSITRTATGPGLAWAGDGYRLQETGNLTPPVPWTPVVAIPTAISGWYFLQLPEPGGTRFYRLEQIP